MENNKTAEQYFDKWQAENKDKWGDYGDYNSDLYAIAFAEYFAAQKSSELIAEIQDVVKALRTERRILGAGDYDDGKGYAFGLVITTLNQIVERYLELNNAHPTTNQ